MAALIYRTPIARTLLLGLATLTTSALTQAAPNSGQAVAAPALVGDFALIDHEGVFHQLSRYADKNALVVMTYDAACAKDKQSLANLEAVRKNWEAKGVAFFLMNSAANQNRDATREAARQGNTTLPILLDHAQLVAETLGIQSSGSAVVLDPVKHTLLYKGPAGEQLGQALDAKTSGSAFATKSVSVQGCAINFPAKLSAKNTPDYAKDIAPIITKNCAVCHHEGGIGPFAMNSYMMVKGFAPMIREVLLTKRMPPMQVDPSIGHFTNARYISNADLQTLVHWVDAGAPRGKSQDDPLTKVAGSKRTDWQLGEPDFVIKANTHEIPATGVLDYINDVVNLKFDEDKWVRAVQFIPGDPAVLHHLLSYVTAPNETADGESSQVSVATRFLEGYAPGKSDAMTFPKDTGVYIPKGHNLQMQFHYTPNGRATKDETVVGLYFYDKPPKYEYLNRSVAGPFKIPPHARDYKVAGDYVFPEDVVVYGLRAHMHFRGHDMKFTADLPDGTKRELLSVPNYSYAWQPTYQLEQPVTLPAGTKVHVTGSFDNSKFNPANPDPDKELSFGLQSFDEMFIGYWSYTSAKPTNQVAGR
jgi:hypothetical protein